MRLQLVNWGEVLSQVQEEQGLSSMRDRFQLRLGDSARDRLVAIGLDLVTAGGGSASEWVKNLILNAMFANAESQVAEPGAVEPDAVEPDATAPPFSLSSDRLDAIVQGWGTLAGE
jgi:hypothetical protein